MGQNFNKILIKRENSKDDDLVFIKEKLEEHFVKTKENLTAHQYYEEKWDDRSNLIIGLRFNENVIIIDDEYEQLYDITIQVWSRLLNNEILKLINSDTAGFCMISIYKNGHLVRKKSFGQEEDIDVLGGEELQAVEGIGETTVYEVNGSNAIAVLEHFNRLYVEENKAMPITVYRTQ